MPGNIIKAGILQSPWASNWESKRQVIATIALKNLLSLFYLFYFIFGG
jgi:hypothetical protein